MKTKKVKDNLSLAQDKNKKDKKQKRKSNFAQVL